jgi:hypothetical protein
VKSGLPDIALTAGLWDLALLPGPLGAAPAKLDGCAFKPGLSDTCLTTGLLEPAFRAALLAPALIAGLPDIALMALAIDGPLKGAGIAAEEEAK